jgi:hypothetical protein
MPVLAIAGAVASGFGAAGAVGAALAGTFTVMGTLQIVGAVGATLGAIGAVTGDKGLQTAGLVMGGIGGIGSLAAGAGLLGDASAPLFGSSTGGIISDSAATGGLTSGLEGPGFGGVGGAGAASAGKDIIGSITSNASQVGVKAVELTPSVNLATDLVTTPLPNLTGTSTDLLASGAGKVAGLINSSSPTADAMPPTTSTAMPGSAPGVATPDAPVAPVVNTPRQVNVDEPGGGAFSGILKFAKENPAVALGTIQAAGSFLQGSFNSLTPAQVAALKAQAANNQASANMTQTQVDNMKQGFPVATRRPGGLINSQPVTGAAA